MNITEIRAKYPQYSDMSDKELVDGLYQKHYSDMDQGEFYQKVGFKPEERGRADQVFTQGVTFGFGDELGGVGSVLGGLLAGSDKSITDLYTQGRDKVRGDIEAFSERNPKTALALELGGGLTTGGVGASRVFGSKLAKEVVTKAPKLTKALSVPTAGATGGGVYGFGTGDGLEDSIDKAKTGAAVGAVAAPVASKLINGTVNAFAKRKINKTIDNTIPSTEQIKNTANSLYKEADNLGINIKENSYGGLIKQITDKASKEGFHPKIHPKVAAALDEFSDKDIKQLTLKELEQKRRILKSAAKSNEADERRVASELIGEIDGYIDNLSDLHVSSGNAEKASSVIKQARANWQKTRKSEMIEEAIEKAKNQASGFENGLRIQFRQILNNKKKTRGFTGEELDALRKIVRGEKTENVLRVLGKMAPNEGAATNWLGMLTGMGGGHVIGGPVGMAAAPLVGMASRNTAQKITRNNVDDLHKLVRGGNRDALAKTLVNQPAGKEIIKQQRLMDNTKNRDALASVLASIGANKAFNY